MTSLRSIAQEFGKLSAATPRYFRSPGRINVIGDHTDYNMGLVLPAAIDKYVTIAIAQNNDGLIRVKALDIDEEISIELSGSKSDPKEHWSSYFIGVCEILLEKGVQVTGVDCTFSSNIPIGAGLSSSAAICCCFAFGLNELFNGGLSRQELVLVAQQTEHEYVGLQCGTMDQSASLLGKKDQVLKIDCRSQEVSYASLALGDYSFIVCDSQVKHSLASSGYNNRKNDCIKAAESFGVKSVREISSAMLKEKKDLNPIIRQRLNFVIEENDRVEKVSRLLEEGNLSEVGQLIYASHEGLKNQYEVSCQELDFLVDTTHQMPYILGARLMGGGFGGCTINLLETKQIAEFKSTISRRYEEAFGISPRFFDVNIVNGTEELFA
ncbi:galactokinase [Roseivirga misakiensis]|uniref:Galactokinase n=1 Tax=Roseivirga misakiensis TaxID=1563681 RepID=A0A1E5T282_9BACT|nr:galactokinase [Roseivirga misakiensis]OEK05407.1 galactokinase [Roseivirga misakiensis]